MTPGSHCHQRHFIGKGDGGQLTIFFAVTLLIVITILAFVINIGLFVKAKINLQNAVDAAAYSGASVQARQLSRIGYLNWEMRNIYKEWMLKYYVLGNLNIEHQDLGGGIANFRAIPYQNNTDRFNFPSICIHYGGVGADVPNLCRLASVPGVPRFAGGAPTGVEESFEELINVIISEKNLDCANRSELNYLAANLWAYGLPDANNASAIFSDSPQLAPNRKGAFPAALELAVRIRNLEHQVNLPPNSGICAFPGRAAGNCLSDISQTAATASVAQERTSKAFYSAYRNLGNDFDRELKDSFTLTELAPTVVIDPANEALSNSLIPTGKREKYYLDLQLMSVNLVTFYTAFVSTESNATLNSGENVATVGDCQASKVGLPVPGYPLGFYKNPDVMTYYSVKGEAFFEGLFNPFNDRIKLTAYATAKPFGGRIGPKLFRQSPNRSAILPRQDNNYKSNPYVLGLDLSTYGAVYSPGLPIPLNGTSRFWVQSAADTLGGAPVNPNEITFSIPNMVYDFDNGFNRSGYNSGQNLEIIRPPENAPRTGLYSFDQLNLLRANVPNVDALLTPIDVDQGIQRVRRPTRYEAANYLIPTPGTVETDSFPIIPSTNNDRYSFYLYAPLYNSNPEDALYQQPTDITGVLNEFILNQSSAIEKYKQSMNDVAITVNSLDNGQAAAQTISDIDDFNGQNTQNPSCQSINGKFIYFYTGDAANVKGGAAGCPEPFSVLAQNYWSSQANGNNNDFYLMEFATDGVDQNLVETLYSAYQPGPSQGASNGLFRNGISTISPQVTMRRNFYSTKFIPMKAVLGGGENWMGSAFTIFSEGNKANEGLQDIVHDSAHKNRLDSAQNNADLERLNNINW